MNDRQRFNAIMHYQPFDRCVIQDFQYWHETLDVWHAYGLPAEVGWNQTQGFFGFDPMWDGVGANVMLLPAFEQRVLEENERFKIIVQADGTTVRWLKTGASIPQEIDHALKDRATWDREFKWRLDPSYPGRLGADLDERLEQVADSRRTFPLSTGAGSVFGQLRNWMGIEAVSYIQYDDPKLFEEMIEAIGSCIVGTLKQLLERARAKGVTFDGAGMWEDMAYSHGPLLGVPAFERLCVPQYQRITGLLREYGVDRVWLDCDGDARPLYPGWLRGGVNVAFPMEVGTWGNDPIENRKRFGKDLLILGGFNKRILASGKDAIAREIDRLAGLVWEGGFIPFCDHRVPPDVSLENYMFYVERAKQVWGRGAPDLRPTGRLDPSAPLYGQPYDFRKITGDAAPKH